MNAVAVSYPYGKYLVAAGLLSLAGQATGLLFMLYPTPYTTIFFIGGGIMLILLAIMVFAFAIYKDAKSRTESVAERNFQAGEVIFRQGEVGDRVYILKNGEVEIIREDPEKGSESIVARLGPGEYFGEMALVTDAPRNATVRAATDVTALSIERQNFQSLFSGIPAIRDSVDAAVKRRRAS